jgi:alpha-beta hydrolase superfamily lysophospholipase
LRRRLLWLAVLLALVVPNALAYLHARAMTHFVTSGQTTSPDGLGWADKLGVLVQGVRVRRPVNQGTPADAGLAFQTHRFAGGAGPLEAWVIEARPRRGVILIFHGYSGSKSDFIEVARRLHEMGWTSVLVDFRGAGGSAGQDTSIGWHEARDVAAAVAWTRESLHEPAPVLYGFSMGAAAVLRAVAVEHVHPRAIIVESAFDRMLSTVENRFHNVGVPAFPGAPLLVFWGGVRHGFNGFAHNPGQYAAAVTCPTLVLCGADDRLVTPTEAHNVFSALAGPKTLHVFPHAPHEASRTVPREDWQAVFVPFLDRVAPVNAQ